jgi:hypothetical protein
MDQNFGSCLPKFILGVKTETWEVKKRHRVGKKIFYYYRTSKFWIKASKIEARCCHSPCTPIGAGPDYLFSSKICHRLGFLFFFALKSNPRKNYIKIIPGGNSRRIKKRHNWSISLGRSSYKETSTSCHPNDTKALLPLFASLYTWWILTFHPSWIKLRILRTKLLPPVLPRPLGIYYAKKQLSLKFSSFNSKQSKKQNEPISNVG